MYLDNSLGHLTSHGTGHTFDNTTDDLDELFYYDLISDAVKATICHPWFKPFHRDDIDA